MVLGSALRGTLSGAGLRALVAELGVPRATLDQWCRWWNEKFPATRLWQGLRGRCVPPIAGALPGGLLERIGAPDLATRITRALQLIAPLSTVSEGR